MDRRRANEGESAEKDNLYSQDTVFQFFSKSKDVAPGKGAGEKIPVGSEKYFEELSRIKDWRKKLSNFWKVEINVDGLRWSSVEHFYHANKYKRNEPEFYRKFSLSYEPSVSEPEWLTTLPHDLSVNPGVAKALGGKTGKYRGVCYRPPHVILDEDFFLSGKSEKVMEAGQRAKYTQHEDLKRMLLATRDAKLVHMVRGSPPIVFYDTMRIRNQSRKGN